MYVWKVFDLWVCQVKLTYFILLPQNRQTLILSIGLYFPIHNTVYTTTHTQYCIHNYTYTITHTQYCIHNYTYTILYTQLHIHNTVYTTTHTQYCIHIVWIKKLKGWQNFLFLSSQISYIIFNFLLLPHQEHDEYIHWPTTLLY